MLSVAVLAAGAMLSNMVGPAFAGNAADVVGVWKWVAEMPTQEKEASVTPLLEIRRDLEGDLEVRILARGRTRAHGTVDGTRITFEEGHLCVVAGDGTSFKGELSHDGRQIEGVIHYSGGRSTVQLKRVERKAVKQASSSSYAT